MRVLLTAFATTVVVAAGPLTATAAGPGFDTPVGGPLLTTAPGVVAKGSTPPAVGASAYLVADVTTGSVLAAKAPHAKLRPASTLKTLTALVLLPRLKKTDVLVGTSADAAIEGSKVGVHPGLKYSVDLLFEGLFLASGNDAVNALASHDQGGVAATIQRMNQKAAELGARDTHVTDPTGLDADGQFSSAYDLALFAQAGLARPDFAKYASTKFTTYPLAENKGTYQVANQNKLLFNYDGALGVKTGYTTLARNTYIGAARRNGHTLVVTMLNSPHGIAKDAAALLDWSFTNYNSLTPVGTLVKPQKAAPPKSSTGGDPPKEQKPASATQPEGSRTITNPSEDLVEGVPAWVYSAPAILLLAFFLKRPRALQRHRRKDRAARAN